MTDDRTPDDELDDVLDSDDSDAAGDPAASDADESDDTDDTDDADEPDASAASQQPDVDELLADEIDSEIVQLATERDQFKDIAQRLQADFENYRKRVHAQVAAETDRATSRLAGALLPVLDAFEAAFVQHPDVIEPLFNLMLAELRKQGLETIAVVDQPFDPNLAEAVHHEPGDGGDTVVAEVLRTGYTWNGRTLRPAMVKTKD